MPPEAIPLGSLVALTQGLPCGEISRLVRLHFGDWPHATRSPDRRPGKVPGRRVGEPVVLRAAAAPQHPSSPSATASGKVVVAPMRITFLQDRAVDESLALCDVAAALRHGGHHCSLVLHHHERDARATLLATRPDLCVVQAPLLSGPWSARAAQCCDGLLTLLAGTGPSFAPDEWLRDEGQRALVGEIDRSLLAVVAALDRGTALRDVRVPGLRWVEGGAIHTLAPDSAPTSFLDGPLPDRALYFDTFAPLGRFPWKRFATGRGCIHACGYCYLPPLRALHGGKRGVRRKSVQRVIDEVRAVRSRWPLQQVHFGDDLFAPKADWLEDFAERWRAEVDLPFSANASPETITARNARSLARAGARLIGIGVEAAPEQLRHDVLGRRSTTEAVEGAVRRLHEAGIRVHTFNLLGAPGSTLDDDLQTLHWNQQMGVRSCRATIAMPMRGTDLWDRAVEAGIDPHSWEGIDKSDVRAACVPDHIDARRRRSLLALFRAGVVSGVDPRWVRRLCALPPDVLRPLCWADALVELRWSGVGLADGLRFGLAAGRPVHRKTFHESML